MRRMSTGDRAGMAGHVGSLHVANVAANILGGGEE